VYEVEVRVIRVSRSTAHGRRSLAVAGVPNPCGEPSSGEMAKRTTRPGKGPALQEGSSVAALEKHCMPMQMPRRASLADTLHDGRTQGTTARSSRTQPPMALAGTTICRAGT